MDEFKNPIALLVLIIVVAAFSAPYGTPALAAFAKDFLPAVATLVAAYAGVWYGSSLRQKAADRERRKKDIGIGSRALFTMWRQLNTIAQIQEDITSKYKNYPPAPLAMPPINIPIDDAVRLDINALSFLIDHEKSELLADLCITEIRYLHAIDVIRRRSYLHANEVQPRLENKLPHGRNLSSDELREIIGPRLFSELVGLTQEVISRTDDAVATLEAVAKDLHMALRTIFPESKFPRPAPMDEEGQRILRTARPIEESENVGNPKKI